LEKNYKMKDEKFEEIIKEITNLKDLPNTKLVEYLDLLSSDFEFTKDSIIKSTLYLDKVEELYNRVLKSYQERNNGK
jgi:hypothetical protein